jgi:hypothetical protein
MLMVAFPPFPLLHVWRGEFLYRLDHEILIDT